MYSGVDLAYKLHSGRHTSDPVARIVDDTLRSGEEIASANTFYGLVKRISFRLIIT